LTTRPRADIGACLTFIQGECCYEYRHAAEVEEGEEEEEEEEEEEDEEDDDEKEE